MNAEPFKALRWQRRTPVAAETTTEPTAIHQASPTRKPAIFVEATRELEIQTGSFQRAFFRGPSVSMPLMTESTAPLSLCVDKPKISFRAIADALRRGSMSSLVFRWSPNTVIRVTRVTGVALALASTLNRKVGIVARNVLETPHLPTTRHQRAD